MIAWLAASVEATPSADTGAYSKAQHSFPRSVLQLLLKRSAQALQTQVKPEQRSLWTTSEGLCVGTTVAMSDTPANQKCYPQHSNQKPGCGFPLAKLVLWFCVTTGSVLEVSISAFTTSVWELARQLYAKLQPDDVVVADSAYGTYVDKSVDPLS